MKVRLSVVAGAGVLAGAAALYLAAHQLPDRPTQPGPALTLIVGVSLLGSGLASWRARPDNRLGLAMVATAFAWLAAQLIEARSPWLYTLGTALQSLWIVGLIYILLSFPAGTLQRRLDRTIVWGTLAIGLGLQLVAMLFGQGWGLRCPGCPDNVLRVFPVDNHLAHGVLSLARAFAVIVIVVIVTLLITRWKRAGSAQRRAVAPVLVAGFATLAALCWTVIEDLLGDPLSAAPANVFFWVFATVPIAIMVVFLQRRLARLTVAGLVVELDQPAAAGGLRQALSRALGDPSLQIAFWFGAGRCFVDAEGATVKLPVAGSGRGCTLVERDGQPIAALLHDPVLEHNAELVRSVCAAASLALENERLQAELRARLVELAASRVRLVEATDAERRRIERDLHDGTQQRLVSIAMSLGLLEAKLPDQAAAARPIVQETRAALAQALAELRELTHGISPPLLVERGLPAALDELCRRAALPTHLQLALDRRLPDQVESAAYFMASEALTNAAKHSHGGEVRVCASHTYGLLTLEITDDGIGGAGSGGGSGLRGLADRIEALGGRFTVSSPPGRGTVLRAEIPCA